MDKFKLRTGLAKVYPLTKEEYESRTAGRQPYVQTVGGKMAYYAICPYCEMPIRIVGLKSDNAKKNVYAAHAGKDVPGLAANNISIMKSCDEYTGGKADDKPVPRLTKKDPAVQNMLSFMRNNYDLIIGFLSDQTGFHISMKHAEELIKAFCGSEGWNYRNVRINNLPWTICEAAAAWNVRGECVKDSTPVSAFMQTVPGVSLEPCSIAGYKRVRAEKQLYLTTQFLNVRYDRASGMELMDFRIVKSRYMGDPEEQFRTTLKIDPNLFVDYCGSLSASRSARLLSIANTYAK